MLLLQVFFHLMFVTISVLLRHFNIWFLFIVIHLPPPLSQLLHYLIELRYPLLNHLWSLLSHEYHIRCEHPFWRIIPLFPHNPLFLLNFDGGICRHRVHLFQIPFPVPLRHFLILLSLFFSEETPLCPYLLHLFCLVLSPPVFLLLTCGLLGFLEKCLSSFS